MKKWEIALLFGLAFTLLWGANNARRQEELSSRIIRLHILANSDSEEDQALKLSVRDKIVPYTEQLLSSEEHIEGAIASLRRELPAIETLAAREIAAQGYAYDVTAELAVSEFPRRVYDGFALPKGEYLSLRLIIGDGDGQNWWCVVYPSLCCGGAADWDALDEEQVALITEDSPRYVLKFRAVELWQMIRQKLRK